LAGVLFIKFRPAPSLISVFSLRAPEILTYYFLNFCLAGSRGDQSSQERITIASQQQQQLKYFVSQKVIVLEKLYLSGA
jgi:hypothetical protein